MIGEDTFAFFQCENSEMMIFLKKEIVIEVIILYRFSYFKIYLVNNQNKPSRKSVITKKINYHYFTKISSDGNTNFLIILKYYDNSKKIPTIRQLIPPEIKPNDGQNTECCKSFFRDFLKKKEL